MKSNINKDDINFICIDLLESQADLILHALELYSYNLEYMIGEKNEADKYKLTMLSSTYEIIFSKLNSSKAIHKPSYNVEGLANQVSKDFGFEIAKEN